MRLVPASGLCVLLLQLALRFFGQQVRHTLQADADGGKIMQHSRGCRLQNAQCAQNDQGRVKAQHKAIVARHTALHGVGNALELHQLFQAVGFDGNIGNFACNGCARVDGDANIGSRQSR